MGLEIEKRPDDLFSSILYNSYIYYINKNSICAHKKKHLQNLKMLFSFYDKERLFSLPKQSPYYLSFQ